MKREWITSSQAAERYGVTERTIRNWVKKYSERITVKRVHPFKFYRVGDLDEVEKQVIESYS